MPKKAPVVIVRNSRTVTLLSLWHSSRPSFTVLNQASFLHNYTVQVTFVHQQAKCWRNTSMNFVKLPHLFMLLVAYHKALSYNNFTRNVVTASCTDVITMLWGGPIAEWERRPQTPFQNRGSSPAGCTARHLCNHHGIRMYLFSRTFSIALRHTVYLWRCWPLLLLSVVVECY
mgnify:CR=1 FL=1